jgi:hypothetical protein
MKALFEQNGGAYRNANDYSVPNLTLQNEQEYKIGIWGQRRLGYLKNHKRILYVNLLTSGKLTEHLQEIDEIAFNRWETIVQQMSKAQVITEQLKAENQMLWVGKMNNICACADEIVLSELIYN